MNLKRPKNYDLALIAAVLLAPAAAQAWQPIPPASDPLVRAPGSQAGPLNVTAPALACIGCHSGYKPTIEPGFLWKGSMMAQSARDPIFWATFVVAAQDSIWLLGNANAADLCERLRSDPEFRREVSHRLGSRHVSEVHGSAARGGTSRCSVHPVHRADPR